MMSLATSFLVRKPHQTARHTRTLHRMPLAKSTSGGRPIFMAAAPARALPVAPTGPAAARNSSDRTMAPNQLPRKQTIHNFTTSPAVTVLRRSPLNMTKAFPVKSSAPAMTTRLRATPKDRPMATLVNGMAPKVPLTVKDKRMPNPM